MATTRTRRALGLLLAAALAAGCGVPFIGPGDPPPPPPSLEPLPENPGQETVTFVARVFDEQRQEVIGHSIGITIESLDQDMDPVLIRDEQTGEETEGVFVEPAGLAPYAATIQPNPAVAFTFMTVSSVVRENWILACEVRLGPDEFGPLLTQHDATTLPMPPGLHVGQVFVTCSYPGL